MIQSIVGTLLVSGALALAAIPAATPGVPAAGPTIHIEDVELFYKVYDAAGGNPSADQLQRDYLDPGSDGLHQFAKVRNITGTRIAATLAEHPQIYSGAKRCMLVPVTGVQIGLEALCATSWLNPNVEDRFVHVIAHEFAPHRQILLPTSHQQAPRPARNPGNDRSACIPGQQQLASRHPPPINFTA
jgi:hypothetical protein